MSRARSSRKCAQGDGERSSHACLAESHGLIALCRRHAVSHSRRPHHIVVPLERVADFLAGARRKLQRKKLELLA